MNFKYTGTVIAFLFSCFYLFSSSGYATQDNLKDENIYWPLPPAKARFIYVKSVYGESRQLDGGIFSGLKRFLFGDDIPRHFSRPHDIAVSDTGLMVVTDPGAAGFHIINTENDEYHFIQQLNETRLLSPIGVAFTYEGVILITDSLAKTIYRVSSEGEKLGQITDKTLQRPTDIAVHPLTKDIYVLDTHGHNIHVYDPSGAKRFQFGKRGDQAGEFNFPTHLTFNRKGELYVTDTMNFRVQVFDKKHQPIARFGSLGDRLGEFSKPKGIALDEQDNVYIVDSHFDHLLVYDKKGRFLLPIGGNGTGPGLFNLPTGVTISQHYIYIIDSYNRRVQILKRLG
jgi:DNA-binding beta-propeller fold protein YncE